MARRPKEIMNDVRAMLDGGNLNMESYRAALPLLMELREKIQNFSDILKTAKFYDKLLCEKVSDYCDGHATALDASMIDEKDGQKAGCITLDGVKYRYCVSKCGFVRNDGSNLTQDFLAALPATWTRSKLELDARAINAEDPNDETLDNEGLKRGIKREWSMMKGDAV